ncbi:TetR/AcrR family transcriptional regulator [Jiella endophytica]|uniref:TetR/AcrR family transcriptional regulator n=1 Tax=Jiella endophytica TaxID=2558362 RepID=A0A4Y8RP21_9HYPH|nr:TetR/AcrR family transcriptional regulator [Jiella endophytica]TFF25329.1 TetR/AcrR family transcriptional regulator [Jiella endophytica]
MPRAPASGKPRGRPPRGERNFAAIRGAEDMAFRRRILTAAAEIFAERGFATASIDEVARRLGATKGLVYHRYRSKGELFADVCEDGLRDITSRLEAIAERRDRAITRLTEAATLHAGDVLARTALHRTLAEAASGTAAAALPEMEADALSGLGALRERYEAVFVELIAGAADQRDLPAGRDTEMLGRIFVAALDAPLAWSPATLAGLAGKGGLIARQLAYFAIRGAGASDATLAEEFSR